ncbi:bacteriocin immunity protein [Enterococcus saigonensis]|uniref:Bacteriocin immunity protein n=1 Tax=Enterococcus saigonensis TaxID=1805431 RepID=A0A679IH99_9ENTE|nr:bacteriocin immunity protein [Enterococcus saigonensis]BCA84595.1 bacteriocin immunity protein [Enterococcus saigonensis]
MKEIKWFSGGSERAEVALSEISLILGLIPPEDNTAPLRQLLFDYAQEINEGVTAVPYILSRMGIAISNCMTKNKIIISPEAAAHIKNLLTLGEIRYGY